MTTGKVIESLHRAIVPGAPRISWPYKNPTGRPAGFGDRCREHIQLIDGKAVQAIARQNGRHPLPSTRRHHEDVVEADRVRQFRKRDAQVTRIACGEQDIDERSKAGEYGHERRLRARAASQATGHPLRVLLSWPRAAGSHAATSALIQEDALDATAVRMFQPFHIGKNFPASLP
jgi:hypothetical protein